jgi:hypothetical protein
MITYLDQVLTCFALMDIEGLRVLLKDEYTYYDVPKDAFLVGLGELFKEIKGDDVECSRIEIFPGACCSQECDLHLGNSAYRLIGSQGFHIDLRFILGKDAAGQDTIKDIYPCSRLVTNERVEKTGPTLTIRIFEDDKFTFKENPNYLTSLSSALEAYIGWLDNYQNKSISLEDIKAWLIKFESTYLGIGGYKHSQISKWKWDDFLRLYHYLGKFVKLLEEFRIDVNRLNHLGETLLDESELIPWILDIERRMEESRNFMMFGNTFLIDHFGTERKITINYAIIFMLDEDAIAPTDRFISWFETERKKLVIKYFSLNQGEVDEFLETNEEINAFYEVGTLLSFHLDIRERFRKQGVFIPFNLGSVINPDIFIDD